MSKFLRVRFRFFLSLEMSELKCRLKCPYSCFSFHFCFLVIVVLVDAYVVCIVSGCCNPSSSALHYVVLESLYRCIDAILNAGESASSFVS